MTRIAPAREPFSTEVQAHFDRIMPPGVPPLALFTTLARSERAWRKFRAGSLLDGQLLSLRERELVIDRTCARAGSEYEWGVHVAFFAQEAELTREQISALLAVPPALAAFSEREAALITTVDALHERAGLTEDEFSQLRTHFGDEQILEVLMLAGFYRTVAYLTNGLALPLERGAARFEEFTPSTP